MGRTVHPPPPSLVQAPLQPAKGGAEVQASTLWQDKPVLFLLLRRPGCVICRAEARRIWGMRSEIEAKGCRMVCLLHELLPTEVKAFSPSFWAGDCFLDVTKAFYREVGGGKVHKGSWLKLILTFFKLKKMQDEARKTVPEDGNLLNADQSMSTLPQPQRLIGQAAQLIGSQRQLVQGEIMVMGGMLVVKKGGAVSFRFSEKEFGDHLTKDAILKECSQAAGLPADNR